MKNLTTLFTIVALVIGFTSVAVAQDTQDPLEILREYVEGTREYMSAKYTSHTCEGSVMYHNPKTGVYTMAAWPTKAETFDDRILDEVYFAMELENTIVFLGKFVYEGLADSTTRNLSTGKEWVFERDHPDGYVVRIEYDGKTGHIIAGEDFDILVTSDDTWLAKAHGYILLYALGCGQHFNSDGWMEQLDSYPDDVLDRIEDRTRIRKEIYNR